MNKKPCKWILTFSIEESMSHSHILNVCSYNIVTLNKCWVVEYSIVISVVLSYIQVFKGAQRREKHTIRKS